MPELQYVQWCYRCDCVLYENWIDETGVEERGQACICGGCERHATLTMRLEAG